MNRNNEVDVGSMSEAGRGRSTLMTDDDDGSYKKTRSDIINPLLIPAVIEKIAMSMGEGDLLGARRVSRDWHGILTRQYRDRVVKTMEFVWHPRERSSAETFIQVMTPSTLCPVERWILIVDLSLSGSTSLDNDGFVNFIRFIAPTIVALQLNLFCIPSTDDATHHPVILDRRERLQSAMDALNQNWLQLPKLKVLEYEFDFDEDRKIEPIDGGKIMAGMTSVVKAAKNLKTFRYEGDALTLEGLSPEAVFLMELPTKYIEKVHFDHGNFGGGPIRYDQILDCGLSLTALIDDRSRASDVVQMEKFLSQQKDSLRFLAYEELGDLVLRCYPKFPTLGKVEKLKTSVSCNSNLDFVFAFPNLQELEIVIDHRGERTMKKMEKSQPFLSLRKLLMSFKASEVSTLDFRILSCKFPNVKHLSCQVNTEDILRQLLDNFSKLKHLALHFSKVCGAGGLESVICGIPSFICQTLKAGSNFEDESVATVYTPLSELKDLEILEVEGDSLHYENMFTELTHRRVFMKMKSLRWIHFLNVKEIPKACQSYVDDLQIKGVDVVLSTYEF